MTISIVTPVYNAPELASQYMEAVKGSQAIIVDNNSAPECARVWDLAARQLGGIYIRNDTNRWYATACNQGYARASGDVVVFANNDIMARGEWLPLLERIPAGALYGPALNMRTLSGQPLIYLDAWWIAARRETWQLLCLNTYNWIDGASGPFDAEAFSSGMYWEDVELCWRASRFGVALRTLDIPLVHLSNYTSTRTPGAYAHTDSNGGDSAHKRIVAERVRQALEGNHVI